MLQEYGVPGPFLWAVRSLYVAARAVFAVSVLSWVFSLWMLDSANTPLCLRSRDGISRCRWCLLGQWPLACTEKVHSRVYSGWNEDQHLGIWGHNSLPGNGWWEASASTRGVQIISGSQGHKWQDFFFLFGNNNIGREALHKCWYITHCITPLHRCYQ